MEKTATLNLRVNPTVKEQAEIVLARLGVPMSTAINMYLNQISLTGGIPFAVTLPKEPEHSRGIRRMLVDNYSVFYVIFKHEVIVTNVLYSASDISERLRY